MSDLRALCPEHEEENFAPACPVCLAIENYYKALQDYRAARPEAALRDARRQIAPCFCDEFDIDGSCNCPPGDDHE